MGGECLPCDRLVCREGGLNDELLAGLDGADEAEFGTRECTLIDGVSADVDLTQPLMIAVHNHGTSP